jgi:hypothetical protein
VTAARAGRPSGRTLGRLAGAVTAGPRPLKVIPAEPAGDVDDLADEVQSRNLVCFERLRVELCGRHTAGSDLRLGVPFGARRNDLPMVKLIFKGCDGLV